MSVFDGVGRNYGALRHQPDPQTLASFQQFVTQQYPDAVRENAAARSPARVLLIFMVVVTVMFVMLTLMIVMGVMLSGAGGAAVLAWLVLASLVLVPCVVLTIVAVRFNRPGKSMARWFRLYWFAQQNGFAFTPNTQSPYYPGMIFNRGYNRASMDRVHSAPGQRLFDIGTMRYTTGSGRSRADVKWGYMAFQLDRKLPHIVLDSRQNNASLLGADLSNLPVSIDRNQRLSLEGNFDDYFTLYCPAQYERDALYVLTPDLMVLLIDNVAPFDVEIIDDVAFVYSKLDESLDHEAYARRLFAILDTVGNQTVRQTRIYADERVADRNQNTVAPQGQRLKTKMPLLVVLITVAVGLSYIVPQIVGLIERIF